MHVQSSTATCEQCGATFRITQPGNANRFCSRDCAYAARRKASSSRLQFVRVCECGCGQPTLLARAGYPRYGHVKGQPLRFIAHHQWRTQGGESGVWHQDKDGYIFRYRPDHPAAKDNGYVAEHRLVMEEQLGRYLTPDEIVHHDDENPANNDPRNLVLTNRPDHARLHASCDRWSRNHERCVDCGTTDLPHQAQGRCRLCYPRWRYENDPDWRAHLLRKQHDRRQTG